MDSDIDSELRAIRDQLAIDKLDSKIVLVTGGAGFLGGWLSDALVSAHATLQCLDNLSTGRASNIQHLLREAGFALIQGDVVQLDNTKQACNLILHFASRASPEEYQRRPIETLTAKLAQDFR